MKKLTQNEAIQVMMGVVTAMINDDKEGREAVYNELSEEELKRVIRWMVRWFIELFGTMCLVQGIDPLEHWKAIVKTTNEGMANGTIAEEE